MAEFDPYLQWLGIRDPQRPPNHYRLLGLELFEANEAVIANAADRQMAHVRTFQAGQHGELSQKVLNELAAARVCLLKPDKKAAYDQQLRAKTAAARPAPAIPRPIPAAAASKPANVAGAAVTRPAAARPAQQAAESPFDEIASAAASTHYSARRKRKQQKSLAPYALAAVVILAIAVFGLVAFKAGPKPDVASNPPNSAAVEPRQADFPQKAPSDIPDKAKPEDKPAIDPKIKPKATPTKQDGSESQTHSPVIEDTRPAENEVATNDTAPNQSPTDLPSEVKEDSPNSKSEADSEPADVAEEAVATETPAANKWPHIGPQPLDSKLVAIPSANDRKAAVERIREIFGKDLDEARTADAKHKLANTLIEQATATKSDPAAQFVLLDLAKDLAVSASDVDLAQHAIELQSDQFAVDPLALKYDALIEINRHARNADARAALVPVATQLVDAAIERNDFALALKFNKFVQQAATKARDRETMKSTLARDKSIKEMQRQQETAIAALEKIKADPKDALANFELGAYLCFVKQDWAEGLLRLSKSNHPLLQDAALQELTKPTAAAKQKQLADLWLKCTQEKDLAGWSDGMKSRAREHYEAALDQLTGLDKAAAEKRLEELSSIPDEDAPRSLDGAQVTIKLPGDVPMTFRRIPAGKFVMGSPPNEPGRANNETQHLVTISKLFYIGVTEVTQAQWMAAMSSNPSVSVIKPDHPVDSVNWVDAQRFLVRLNQLAGTKRRNFRLPTEAEWEYACRSGSQSAYCFGDNVNQLQEFAWFEGNSGSHSHPVSSLRANAWGLFDMHGNVIEWCADFMGPYAGSPETNPLGPHDGTFRTYRSFYYRSSAALVRSASRASVQFNDQQRHQGFGLRIAFDS